MKRRVPSFCPKEDYGKERKEVGIERKRIRMKKERARMKKWERIEGR
jgi:hypothetical protein